jgi:hypothetical protein
MALTVPWILLLRGRISVVDLGHLIIASERLFEFVPGRVWRIFFFFPGCDVEMLAYYLDKRRSIRDGDCEFAGSIGHRLQQPPAGRQQCLPTHDDLPIRLTVGASGQIKGGRHPRYPKETEMTNLLLTVLDRVGVPEKRIGARNP